MIQDQKPYAATRAAAVLTMLSILSPVIGLVVEMTLAWRFGASGMMDGYRIATWVIGVGAQLFLGNLLPHVVVPLFSQYRAQDRELEGWRFAFSILVILCMLSLCFVGWVWLDRTALVNLIGPGLPSDSSRDAGLLVRFFSIALVAMACSGVATGILYAHRIFWLSALGQALPNLFVALAIIAAGGEAGTGALVAGTLIGYGLLFVMLALGVKRIGNIAHLNWSACFRPCSIDVLHKAARLALPLVASIFIAQWGIVVINRVLSGLSPGTLAEFGYAWKMLALVSLLPAGLATVVFPAFSDAHASDDKAEFARLTIRALRMTLFLTVPLATLLYVERDLLVGAMFGRGGMTEAAQAGVARLFGILLVGAPAGALVVALNKIAYSMHDTKSATKLMLFSALFITVLAPFAARTYGAHGVAWVTSMNTWVYALLMLGYLVLRKRVALPGAIVRYAAMLAVVCIGATVPAMAMQIMLERSLHHGIVFLLAEIASVCLTYVVVCLALSRWLGIGEASEIVRYVQWQFRQRIALGKPGLFADERNNE